MTVLNHPALSFLTTFALLIAVGAESAAQQTKAEPVARKPDPAMQKIDDVPGLPRVLLIGDSISMGYTVPVRTLLKDKANVHRPLTNCGPTTKGLEALDQWLGTGKWDVIHFNWGLHDLKWCDDKGTITDVGTGHQQVPIADYEKNLRALVARLKQTGAKLIWCSTTPVPEGTKGRVPRDEVKYNQAAARVMKEEGVATDDLYAFALPQLGDIQLPKNVHFKPEGYAVLGKQVVRSIETAAAVK